MNARAQLYPPSRGTRPPLVTLGAAAGAVAGGPAGNGVGELIDPTTEDNWLRGTFGQSP
jgi:hypothetical protein